MNVSYQWLSEYVDLSNVSAKELAELLTRGGVEVDGVESRDKGVEKVVVGYVVSKEKHPDADKLNVCQVDAGTGEILQIVCGAKNVDAGQYVPVALVGAKLPGGLLIKRAKLRGVESQGMICSAKELGLNDKLLPKEIQEGILVLPQDSKTGSDILKVLGINDEVLELDLTPNRSDCLSMIGVAYEAGALLGRQVTLPNSREDLVESDKVASDLVRVTIHDPEECRYLGVRVIENVNIGPSPLWIQNRLMAAGVRPINNVVDITNYAMLEYGQPLHAYDADTLAGGGRALEVRLARPGERLETLDGNVRELAPHMLVITDGDQPVGLAGVMGGARTEVTPSTTRIVLEAAHFSGGSVRRTSRELGLRSEASLRFEKEVNPEAVAQALDRAASLMCRFAGGLSAEGRSEAEASKPEPQRIQLTCERINEYLGTELSSLEVKAILQRLGFGAASSDGAFEVLVPMRRGDITRDVDLIEEIARLYGYDEIPTTLIRGATTPGALTKPQRIAREIRRVLSQSGLHEAVTYSLSHADRIGQLPGLFQSGRTVRLAMPMSEERSVLRTCLLPNLAEAAVHNRNRNMDDVALFEIGSVFLTEEEQLSKLPEERRTVAALFTGAVAPIHWSGKNRVADFYDLKGILEKLLSYIGIGEITYEGASPAGFHPGRTAELFAARDAGRIKLGRIGQLHPELQTQWELGDTYVFELDFAALVEAAGDAGAYVPLPKYPSAARDIAVVVDRGVPAGALTATIRATAGDRLESVQVFDIYTGERLGSDKKSIAIALVYRHAERTLTDEEVAEAHGRVTEALAEQHGAQLRK